MVNIKEISGFNSNGDSIGRIKVSLEEEFECPFCHKSIETQPLCYIGFQSKTQVLLKCKSCKNSFIGDTTKIQVAVPYYKIIKLSKGTHKNTDFVDEIKDLSPAFVEIYGEAEFAENENLNEICGVGYRKALEFLVKDYLINNNPDNEEEIKSKFLGRCIDENIENLQIKEIAKRATWLGNDETHYVRKWEDRDLKDLKILISITVHYIIMEIKSNNYLEQMQS